jgi:hypothetical protein
VPTRVPVCYRPRGLFAVAPGEFAALGGRLLWAETRCPVTERVAYEESVCIHHRVLLGNEEDLDDVGEAISKIRGAVDERRSAEHPPVHIKSMSRADRDRATSG